MRLIDADEFKKYISNMPLTNASKEMFKNAIKAQPTVYDINKIAEHDSELLDKVMQKWRTVIDDDGTMYKVVLLKDIEDMKAEVEKCQ